MIKNKENIYSIEKNENVLTFFSKNNTYIKCTTKNIDKEHSIIEMFLFSFFDASYAFDAHGLVLENSSLRYIYFKYEFDFYMYIEVLSPESNDNSYNLYFFNKEFELSNKNTKSRNILLKNEHTLFGAEKK